MTDLRASAPGLFCVGLLFFALAVAVAVAVIMATPLKNILPGYLKESERNATENAMIRLDSLRMAFDRNSNYLAKIMMAADTSRVSSYPQDSVVESDRYQDIYLGRGREEQRFVENLRDNEKYTLSVIAPLAAEDMMFFPICDRGVISPSQSSSRSCVVTLPVGSAVSAMADATVVAVYYNPRLNGYSIVLQHPKGFVSRYSRLSTPLVGEGDRIPGGQIIALTDEHRNNRNSYITVEMWQNGVLLHAADYLDPGATDYQHKLTRALPDSGDHAPDE